jgi:uncharacterized membrane protein YidH (DUF202 family)
MNSPTETAVRVPPWTRILAYDGLALIAAISAVAIGFYARSWHVAGPAQSFGPRGYATALGLVFGVAGALIAAHRPGNAIGWICLACGVLAAINGLGEAYALSALRAVERPPPLAAWAAWTNEWIWILYLEAMGVVGAIFPDGRWRSRRWRNVIVICCVGVLTVTIGNALLPELIIFAQFENPVGLHGLDTDTYVGVLGGATWFFGLSLILVGAASAAARFRHARGDERQQLKWLALAAALIAAATTTVGVVTGFTGVTPPGFEWIEGTTIASISAIPIAIAIGILRHRLYDVDIIINRALVYSAVSVVLALGYGAVVVGLQTVLPHVAHDSSVAVAVSTLAMVALFGPLRRRVQDVVDRNFYRRKYDTEKTIARFGARLRHEGDLDAMQGDLISVVDNTMQPAHTSLWLRPHADSTPMHLV